MAIRSQNCFGIRRQISKLHFDIRLWWAVIWQGGHHCSMTGCNLVFVHLLCFLSFNDSGCKRCLLSICHRKVDSNLTKCQAFWCWHHKDEFNWVLAWIFIWLIHHKVSKALAYINAESNLLQRNCFICLVVVKLEVTRLLRSFTYSLPPAVLRGVLDEVLRFHWKWNRIVFTSLPFEFVGFNIVPIVPLNYLYVNVCEEWGLLTSFLFSSAFARGVFSLLLYFYLFEQLPIWLFLFV